MKLVLLGPPGAGKGTQAETLIDRLKIPAISTGMLLRNAISNKTELGLKAKSFIDSGDLVPDELVVGLLRERLLEEDCQNGFILDGFPRTQAQAEMLDKICAIDKVLSIELADEKILQRLSGRRVCNGCGASYHTIFKPSKVDMICDSCGGGLTIRDDDKPETIKRRLSVYHEQTEPIKAYYKAQGKLCEAYGQEDVKDTTKEVLKALGLE
jgi:adenylate kinases